jgi:Ca2+-binding RTX toxin-like protein
MRLLTIVGVLVAGVLAAPVWAGAATVSISEGGENATLLYEAGPGERNDVVINGTDYLGISGWLVTEEGVGVVLTPGPGCASVTAQIVRCTLTVTEASIEVVVLLGDEGDVLSAAGACGYLLDETGNGCGKVRIRGGRGEDVLIGPDVAESRHVTVIRGDGGGDYLVAGEPGSELIGGPGGDWLVGARGPDTLRGGRGEDRIIGGSGRDLLFGGRQNDTFFARDRTRDQVRGGSGRDRARIDVRRDLTRSIERLF